MERPPEIVFHQLDRPDWAEGVIRQKIEKLEQYHSRIVGCRVVVEAPPRHKTHGGSYRVRIELRVPDGDLLVNREHPLADRHEDLRSAIRDAFRAMRRQLQDFVARKQGKVKAHAPQAAREPAASEPEDE